MSGTRAFTEQILAGVSKCKDRRFISTTSTADAAAGRTIVATTFFENRELYTNQKIVSMLANLFDEFSLPAKLHSTFPPMISR